MIVRPLIRDLIRKPMERGNGGRLLPPTAAMEAWYRKGVGITSAANAVSNWANQAASGAARNYAQATGAAQPTLQGDGTILWNGTSHFLQTATFTLAQPMTRYLRLKHITWTLNDYICDGFAGAGNSASLYQGGASPTLILYPGTTSNSDLALNTWGSVAAVYNGASSSLKVGSNAAVTGTCTEATAPAGLTLGAAGNVATGFSNIQVAEEIVYSVAHDAATQAAIIAYLNTL